MILRGSTGWKKQLADKLETAVEEEDLVEASPSEEEEECNREVPGSTNRKEEDLLLEEVVSEAPHQETSFASCASLNAGFLVRRTEVISSKLLLRPRQCLHARKKLQIKMPMMKARSHTRRRMKMMNITIDN